MRYPEGHKEAVREKVVAIAAAELRAHGIDGVSIPALMKKVGLTHGGFYAHFANRDELVAAAVDCAADETAARVFGDDAALRDVLDAYLSPAHALDPKHGCVIAALGTEARGRSGPIRRAFARGVRGLLRLVEEKLHPGAAHTALHDDTLRITAAMVGAVVLARLVGDEALATRILHAARQTR